MPGLHYYLVFSDARARNLAPREVGGKAYNLARLLDFGFPVPPGCVLTTHAFDETVRRRRTAIKKILTTVDFSTQSSVNNASRHIGEIIFHLPLIEARKLIDMLAATMGEGSCFAVRSSVVGEDSARNSFAGQMDTFLNVPIEQVPQTIKKVWASAFSSRALVYRKRKHLSLIEVSTAVIIQKMVPSAAAGVLFTRNHENGAQQCVIAAGLGLGEGVVADIVETDTYRIGWHANEISKDVSIKDCRVVFDTSAGWGTRKEPVPTRLKSLAVLSDEQIQRLRDVGIKAERCFKAPQDMEWAFDDRGTMFILQSRPMVVTADLPPSPSVRIWDNSNIVESYPGLTLPLTFSFVRSAYESTFRNTALGFILLQKGIAKRLHIFKHMVGLLDGRIYYNLRNWYEMLSYLPGFQRHKKSWDQMIGITHYMEIPRGRLGLLNRVYALSVAGKKLLSGRRTATKFFSSFNPIYARFKNKKLAAAAEEELVELYETFTQELEKYWGLTLDNDFCSMTYYDALKRLCGHRELNGYSNLHNDLLCGQAGVESVAPVRSLVKLAETFQKEPRYRALLKYYDDHAVWRQIQINPDYTVLKTSLESYLRSFGDRSLEELKLDAASLDEQPDCLIGLIRNYVRLGLSVENMERREHEIRNNAENHVRHNLKSPLKRRLFNFVLGHARSAIASRENMRFARSRVFGVIKRLFKRMAEIFVQKDLLEAPSDIHYLTVEEIIGFVKGTAVTTNLKALVQIRKAEYCAFARRSPAERIETVGIPYVGFLSGSDSTIEIGNSAKGIGCSSGTVAGTARIIFDPRIVDRNDGQILVTRSTDPAWIFLMVSSKGLVVEKGSVLSHTAIIGRELGIPTIVGVKDATRRIPDGTELSIDGSTGEIRWQ